MKDNQELDELWERIQTESIAPAALEKSLRTAGSLALEKGDYYIARKVFTQLGDSMQLQVCAEKALASQSDWAFDAALAFETLGDREGLFRTIVQQDKIRSTHTKSTAQKYIGEETNSTFCHTFQLWSRKKGFRNKIYALPSKELLMAHELSKKYDVAIGIARAGIPFAYLCSLLGLETYIADCHKKGRKNTSFAWKDEIHIEKGSRVLVLDNDVVSGRTSERVLQEILKYTPQEVDLALSIDPKTGPFSTGSIVGNIPSEYGKVYFPKDFSYQHFPQAVQRLEEVLCR